MKKVVYLLIMSCLLFACSEEEVLDNKAADEVLIETKDGIYYEYYPGKKQVKITGPVDENSERNGKWELYNENGRQVGQTMYEHGKKHGYSITSYPDATPHYYGEYWADTMIGVWKYYDKAGKVVEKDYGLPADY